MKTILIHSFLFVAATQFASFSNHQLNSNTVSINTLSSHFNNYTSLEDGTNNTASLVLVRR